MASVAVSAIVQDGDYLHIVRVNPEHVKVLGEYRLAVSGEVTVYLTADKAREVVARLGAMLDADELDTREQETRP
jgi:hypothetical protein